MAYDGPCGSIWDVVNVFFNLFSQENGTPLVSIFCSDPLHMNKMLGLKTRNMQLLEKQWKLYDTNPNNALITREIPQKYQQHLHEVWSPPKGVPFNDPCKNHPPKMEKKTWSWIMNLTLMEKCQYLVLI